MREQRRFCRFSSSQEAFGPVTREIPEGGFCLSAFLVITKKGGQSVLLGKINPLADWEYVGALDKRRVEMFKNGWMLPSSHLILYESPQDAAKRILREQVGLTDVSVIGPDVVSETYRNPRYPGSKDHWDIEFIFKSTLDKEPEEFPEVWTDLKFVELNSVKKEDIVRSHGDIIEYAGVYKW
jgi:ADP-ribose pyrophosphatase YjhB (NUDIX family)